MDKCSIDMELTVGNRLFEDDPMGRITTSNYSVESTCEHGVSDDEQVIQRIENFN